MSPLLLDYLRFAIIFIYFPKKDIRGFCALKVDNWKYFLHIVSFLVHGSIKACSMSKIPWFANAN